jgi:hypothetical protein
VTSSTLWLCVLLFGLGYRVGELMQVGSECAEETRDCVPAHAAPTVLDLRYVGRVDPEASTQLVLSEPCAVTQLAECSAEHDLILCGFVHPRLYVFGQPC